MPLTDSLACDFLNPSRVVCAAHIIPRYSTGKDYSPADHTTQIFSQWANDKEDWLQYYINPFANRDMMMRFHWGSAAGHAYSHPEDDVNMPTSPATGITVPCLPEDHMDVDNNTPSEWDGGSSVSTKSSPSEVETDSDNSTYDRRDEDSNLSSGSLGWNSKSETKRWDTNSQDGDSEDLDL
ncbi:hypothetical protein FA13DRAFT_1800604 [Coprinellus micaceus]|uniref:Uncharacterized protein n=1 Tax=Coprinellus micaceus TaxID=71717 RepID=A0A4Y7SG52_COPMI|nr:hypothetical protein FA13DRAFT_1800604 [Coprinellus micaceus]